MVKQQAFDVEKYLEEQTSAIRERVAQSDNKLYLEFGGKLVFDYHAARVLPGFDPNVKMKLLQKLKDQAEIILCIYAGHIDQRKTRADFGITYDADAMKLIDDIRGWGLEVNSVVVTRYEDQPAVKQFINSLERRNIRVYIHRATKGYPTDIDLIVSDDGYGMNPYIETTKPLVVITGPGPNSGKLGTCLSQLYHEHKRGLPAGYAKFESFPIWNIPLKHPVNIAYEAATADLKDINLIDPFHLETYGKTAVNYNRDVDAFPLLKRILEKISGSTSMYQSPTDMGVNRIGFAIIDDAAACNAAKQEIIRRSFRYACEYMMGLGSRETVDRAKLIMQDIGCSEADRPVVHAAREAAEEAHSDPGKGHGGIYCGAAIELPDGSVVTGKNSPIMHAAASAMLNAIKRLADLPDKLHLISPSIIESIAEMKRAIKDSAMVTMDLEETLIALGTSTASSSGAYLAVKQLKKLKGCEMHVTHMPSPGDEAGLRDLGIHVTSDPRFSSDRLHSV
ncbi:MAG: DUF1846 domain-containing protein [Spirochaetes bacterium]|nr:DUF1846 domain-containing protein [Spirochaetota bacterium]MBL7006399.1 DUF1846 domain-containing protein [Spirochaetia bacterium]